jgi:hypothetical protein
VGLENGRGSKDRQQWILPSERSQDPAAG